MLEDLIHRRRDDSVWRKIPWDDPDFSRRMLREHLSQDHDAASRRTPTIDRAVAWIHGTVLGGRPSSILDLGCGPGFYAHRFVKLGHTCKGIDFGPASIDYARTHHLGDYVLADVETAEYGAGYDLVCMIYGELNAFSPQSAQRIVAKAHHALKPGGALLLEVMSSESIRRLGHEPATWYSAEKGLFSDKPHLVLLESSFRGNCACSWNYTVDVESGAVAEYVAMHQAYGEDEYRRLLGSFSEVTTSPPWTGAGDEDDGFFVVVARK